MNIVHIIFSFKIGGSENLLVDIINEQIKSNDVTLIIINNEIEDYLLRQLKPKVNVLFLDRKPGTLSILKVIKLNLILLSLKPNLIHCHQHNLISFIKVFNNKTILTLHSIDIPIKNLKKFYKVFAISESVKVDIVKRGGPISNVIYNGINFELIQQKEFIKNSNIFKIVQIGRLDSEIKGQHILIEALSLLVNNYGIDDIELDFIGEGTVINSVAQLKNRVNELNLQDKINFIGLKDRDYIYENIKNYDLLVQPSITEGFGLTIIEGIAAKVPVLVSNISSALEVTNNGSLVFVFESENVHSCANQIFDIIKNISKEEIRKKSHNAYIYARSKFDVKKNSIEYLNFMNFK